MAKASILAKATKLGFRVHAIAVQPDHVHIAFEAPPSWSPAKMAQHLKGASSHHLGREFGSDWVGWQAEYGVVAFGGQSLDRVVKYIVDQDAHHRENNLWLVMEEGIDESETAGEIHERVRPPSPRH